MSNKNKKIITTNILFYVVINILYCSTCFILREINIYLVDILLYYILCLEKLTKFL